MVPTIGFELMTYRLQGDCTTTVLSRLNYILHTIRNVVKYFCIRNLHYLDYLAILLRHSLNEIYVPFLSLD